MYELVITTSDNSFTKSAEKFDKTFIERHLTVFHWFLKQQTQKNVSYRCCQQSIRIISINNSHTYLKKLKIKFSPKKYFSSLIDVTNKSISNWFLVWRKLESKFEEIFSSHLILQRLYRKIAKFQWLLLLLFWTKSVSEWSENRVVLFQIFFDFETVLRMMSHWAMGYWTLGLVNFGPLVVLFMNQILGLLSVMILKFFDFSYVC